MTDCGLTSYGGYCMQFRTRMIYQSKRPYFVLVRHTESGFSSCYIYCSQKQQPTGRNSNSLGHILPIPSQPVSCKSRLILYNFFTYINCVMIPAHRHKFACLIWNMTLMLWLTYIVGSSFVALNQQQKWSRPTENWCRSLR